MVTKILIIRFSSIGDIVLTTPVIRCAKEQWEGEVEIHYVTKQSYAPILTSNPYLSEVHTIENNVSEIADKLYNEGFDYVIDLHRNLRSGQLKRKLKVLDFTVDKINVAKWVMVNFKINRLPNIHIVDRYLDTLKAFGIKNDGKGLDYFIPEEEEVEVSSLPETHRDGYIAYAIGGQHFTKKMPEEKILSLCKKISYPLVLLGGKEDYEIGQKVATYLGSNIYNACGKYSLNQSASIVRQAHKVISHDTGLMHIAAAFKKDIVSIWGNTIPEFGMYPHYPEGLPRGTIIQVEDLSCRPCSKIGFKKCPKKHFNCMNLIDEGEIVEALGF